MGIENSMIFNYPFIKGVTEKKSDLIFFLFIFFILILNIVIVILFFPINQVDFILQVEAAKQIALGKSLYTDIGKIEYNGRLLPEPQYPPVYLYFLAGIYFIFPFKGYEYEITRIILIISAYIVAFQIFLVTRSFLSTKAAKLVSFAFLFHPATLGTYLGFHEYFLCIFLLMSLILYLKQKYILSGVFLGVATLTKPISIIFLFIFFLNQFKRDLKIKNVFSLVFTYFVTILLGSLPFLIQDWNSYIYRVIIVHLTRKDPNLSIYYYWFPTFPPLPFILQMIFVIVLPLLLKGLNYRKAESLKDGQIYLEAQYIWSSFYFFNRIFYPHYMPIILVFSIFGTSYFYANFYRNFAAQNKKKRNEVIFFLMLAFIWIGMYIGLALWSITWLFDSTPLNYNDLLGYYIGAFIFHVNFAAWCIFTFYMLYVGRSGGKYRIQAVLKKEAP